MHPLLSNLCVRVLVTPPGSCLGLVKLILTPGAQVWRHERVSPWRPKRVIHLLAAL